MICVFSESILTKKYLGIFSYFSLTFIEVWYRKAHRYKRLQELFVTWTYPPLRPRQGSFLWPQRPRRGLDILKSKVQYIFLLMQGCQILLPLAHCFVSSTVLVHVFIVSAWSPAGQLVCGSGATPHSPSLVFLTGSWTPCSHQGTIFYLKSVPSVGDRFSGFCLFEKDLLFCLHFEAYFHWS